MFLKTEKDSTSKQFDDDEWIRSLTEAEEITVDVPEDTVMYDQQEVDPKKVQPIQMGKFLRKYVSRRRLAFSEGEIAALTTSMRQLGVGTPGGAEAHLPSAPLRRVGRRFTERTACQKSKSTKNKCFGMIEWQAVREAASRFLPKHTAAAAGKHWNLSHVEQEGLPLTPKDRGAEQGDVDGPLECSVASGNGGSGNVWLLGLRQAAFHGLVLMTLRISSQAEHAVSMYETAHFQLGGPEKLTGANDPQDVLRKNGGLADL